MGSDVRFNLPFSLGIGDLPPTTTPEVQAFATEVYNAFVQLQLAIHAVLGVGQQLSTLWPTLDFTSTLHTFSATRYYRRASENIAYGATVNLTVVAGEIQFRNANATNNTKQAHGFCTTTGGILAGTYGEVILFQGLLTGVAGLVQGTRYFLSTVNGQVTAIAPVAAGNIEQPVGFALTATDLLFCFSLNFLQH